MDHSDRAQIPCIEGGCHVDEAAFPFWAQQANLREHWYPLAFAHTLKPNQVRRQVALGVPIVLWRTDDGCTKGFVDICPHRQAQLSQGSVSSFGLTCPYHGWRFGSDGRCNHIPVSPPERMPRETVTLTQIPTCQQDGMIWTWLGQGSPTATPNHLATGAPGWRFTRARRVLPFDLDDIVENFMDFAHTPVVHPGLIRGISQATERGVTIEVDCSSVRSMHDPVDERVGFLSGLVVPRGEVHHSDTFVLPGNVKVEYGFGSEAPSFVAFLGMTPVRENETLLLVSIGWKFGWLNPLISLALPLLIRKVLAQDEHILAQQRENLDLISKRTSKSIESDSVDTIVRAMRSHAQDPSRPRPQPGTRRMLVRI